MHVFQKQLPLQIVPLQTQLGVAGQQIPIFPQQDGVIQGVQHLFGQQPQQQFTLSTVQQAQQGSLILKVPGQFVVDQMQWMFKKFFEYDG